MKTLPGRQLAETGDQYDKRFGSSPFIAQTQWLADSAAALKIPFVIHLGDVVDQVGKPQQWDVADKAMKVLEDKGLPYSILAGNHDVVQDIGYQGDQSVGTDAQRDLTQEPYLKWFGSERAKKQGTFGGRDPSGFHEYHVFKAEGQKFLVLSLSWRVSRRGNRMGEGGTQKQPDVANDPGQPRIDRHCHGRCEAA